MFINRLSVHIKCSVYVGLVCVWDLEINLPWSPHPGSSEDGLVINPIVQLTAHKAPCRTVTWCPHDVNYLFTGINTMLICAYNIMQCTCLCDQVYSECCSYFRTIHLFVYQKQVV